MVVMFYKEELIGNLLLFVLYGGVIVVFLEIVVIIELLWVSLWQDIEIGVSSLDEIEIMLICLLKIIDFMIDYLCLGLLCDVYVCVKIV